MTQKRDTHSGGTVLASWTWDPAGDLGALDRSTQLTAWGTVTVDNETFDVRHRVTRRSWDIPGAGTFDMAYSYLQNDAVNTIRYPSNNTGGLGETVDYGYFDPTGEVETMTGVNGETTTEYVVDTDYVPAGMLRRMVHLGTGASGLNRSNSWQASTQYLTWTQTRFGDDRVG